MGAQILGSAKEVWAIADMMVKVKEPLPEEYAYFKEGLILYTYLHLAADRPLTDALLKSKVCAVAYETIRDKTGALPLLRPMSEVAGRLSIQAGAKCLEKPAGGMGLLLGGIPGVKKAHVMILGAGVVGMSALKMALGLGARVSIFDNNIARLAYLDDLFGQQIQTVFSTDTAIEQAIVGADLVIGGVLIPGAAAPKLIKRAYLKTMKKGSVIVDVAVDHPSSTVRPKKRRFLTDWQRSHAGFRGVFRKSCVVARVVVLGQYLTSDFVLVKSRHVPEDYPFWTAQISPACRSIS